MALTLSAPSAQSASFSPLVLADRLLALAQDADRAGYRDAASQMVGLVFAVMENGVDQFLPARSPSLPSSASH